MIYEYNRDQALNADYMTSLYLSEDGRSIAFENFIYQSSMKFILSAYKINADGGLYSLTQKQTIVEKSNGG